MSVFTNRSSPPRPNLCPTRTYSFGFVEMCHLNVAPVMVGQIEEVEGEADPEVNTRHPHEDGVLKALGEVRVAGVPRDGPLLQTQTQARGQWDASRRNRGRCGAQNQRSRDSRYRHDPPLWQNAQLERPGARKTKKQGMRKKVMPRGTNRASAWNLYKRGRWTFKGIWKGILL